MRRNLLYVIGIIAAILLARNLYNILMVLPDEARQDAIWRIFTFHLPAAIVSLINQRLIISFEAMMLRKSA